MLVWGGEEPRLGQLLSRCSILEGVDERERGRSADEGWAFGGGRGGGGDSPPACGLDVLNPKPSSSKRPHTHKPRYTWGRPRSPSQTVSLLRQNLSCIPGKNKGKWPEFSIRVAKTSGYPKTSMAEDKTAKVVTIPCSVLYRTSKCRLKYTDKGTIGLKHTENHQLTLT